MPGSQKGESDDEQKQKKRRAKSDERDDAQMEQNRGFYVCVTFENGA